MADYQVYVEDGFEEMTTAHVLALPGCFAGGETAVAALAAVPRALHEYSAWLRCYGEEAPPPPTVRFEVVEQVRCPKVGGVEVGAFFGPEAAPIELATVERAVVLLGYSRADLLELIGDLDDAALDWHAHGEAWQVRRVLMHVARAEVFYYILFNETAPVPVPTWMTRRYGSVLPPGTADPRPFLAEMRAAFVSWLRGLGSEQSARLIEDRGERWSVRKVIRRALWNERRRTGQVRALLNAYRSQ